MKKIYMLIAGLMLTFSGYAQLKKMDGISVFPNPASDNIMVSFSTDETASISTEIIDMIGNSVYVSKDETVEGVNNRKISTESLTNGIYFLKMSDGKNTVVKKFIVKH
jgi:bacillolysin